MFRHSIRRPHSLRYIMLLLRDILLRPKRESAYFFVIQHVLKLLLLDKRRWPSGRRSLTILLVCSVKLPPPFGLKP